MNHIDDYNGKIKELMSLQPNLQASIKRNDIFWSGINEVKKFKYRGSIHFFIETPGHGWFLNNWGIIIGNEDDGLHREPFGKGWPRGLAKAVKNAKVIL
jgi:hypothetical protein